MRGLRALGLLLLWWGLVFLIGLAIGLVKIPRAEAQATCNNYVDLIQNRLSKSPQVYYRLGEASGTTCTDAQACSNGTYSSSPTLGQTGAILNDSDTAVKFAGAGQRCEVADGACVDPPSGNTGMSLVAWVKTNAAINTTDHTIVAKWNSVGLRAYLMGWDHTTQKMACGWSSDDDFLFFASSPTGGDNGSYHLFVCVFAPNAGSTGTVKAYIDNASLGDTTTINVATGSNNISATFDIGCQNSVPTGCGTAGQNSTDDEVVVFNGPLTTADIQAIYAAGTAGCNTPTPATTATPTNTPTPTPTPSFTVTTTRTIRRINKRNVPYKRH